MESRRCPAVVSSLASVLVLLAKGAGWLAHATPMPGRALLGGGGARSSAAARLPLLLLPARPLQAALPLRVVAGPWPRGCVGPALPGPPRPGAQARERADAPPRAAP